jgi:branched-subunit amino acid ABC-type transport system permease component
MALHGCLPGWRAFTAAIIGGIGSIVGALFGGFMLGMVTILLVAFFPEAAGYRDAIIFVLLVVILLVKPTAFLARRKVGDCRGSQNEVNPNNSESSGLHFVALAR